jgi:hypothetical protein
MSRGMPYVICNTDGRPVDPDEAKAIIAQHWTVPADVRARRRSKKMGKAPQQVLTAQVKSRPKADRRGDLPDRHRPRPLASTSTDEPLDNRSPIGNQSSLSAPSGCLG